jgi:hypothetical protein
MYASPSFIWPGCTCWLSLCSDSFIVRTRDVEKLYQPYIIFYQINWFSFYLGFKGQTLVFLRKYFVMTLKAVDKIVVSVKKY